MPDNNDIADRLRSMADEIEADDLPSHNGYQMVEELNAYFGLDLYLDSDGDLWFFDGDEVFEGGGPHYLDRGEVEYILDRMEDA